MRPITPQYQALLRDIDAAVRAGNLERAAELAEVALSAGPEHPGLLNLAAQRRAGRGDIAGAIAMLDRARKLAPGDVHVLNTLAYCLEKAGRMDEAMLQYDAAIRVQPNFAPAYYNKGAILEERDEIAPARALYEQAVRVQPVYPEALARLALFAARRSDAPQARDLAMRALQGGAHVPAMLALALADYQDGNMAGAKAHADAVIANTANQPRSRSIALGILGDIEDKAGRTRDAFDHFVEAKRVLLDLVPTETGALRSLDQVALLKDYFASADAARWAAPAESDAPPCRTHVFLVGFPRSGTTLLETVLAGHGDVVTMEEKELLVRPAREFLASAKGLDRLSGAFKSALQIHRAAYWKACAAYVPAFKDKVFIDKLPLNSIVLCLIAKLFPQAKILFAIRDPRDVVLSCLRQRFGLNLAMSEFLTLEGTARFYDGVMGLSDIYREKLSLDRIDVRYDDLVKDFDGSLAGVCAFLGIEPEPGMRDVAARARERTINTPSAPQLARGLYDGTGQWRRYAAQLAPVMPVLEPWVRRFGYSPE